MSLITEVFEACVMLDKRTVSDGRGGIVTTWVEGAGFSAAAIPDDTPEMRVAQAQGTKTRYNVVTTKAINLQYHDVFRRSRDSKVFRVTSDGDDVHTPASATLDLRKVSAEEYVLPTGV